MIGWIFGIGLGCMVLERLRPGWRLPRVRTWPLRTIAINLVQLGIVLFAGQTWERWLQGASLFALAPVLPYWLGGALAHVSGERAQ